MKTPAMRIDAHQHYWSIAYDDYGWLQPNAALRPIHRDFAPNDLKPWLNGAGIDATVLVQAAPSEAETRRLLRCAAEPASRVAGVVGWCDLLHPRAPQRIEQLARESPLLRGLRPMLQDVPDPRWVLQPKLQPALRAMVACGLILDALVKGDAQLQALCEFAPAHPSLTIVLDHAGKPPIATGPMDRWGAAIARLADMPNVWCKLSGLVTEAGQDWSAARLQPWVDVLLRHFGPQRLN